MTVRFKEYLRMFAQYGGHGIVYGGCLRDTLCGVGPLKDIDIALSDTPENKQAVERLAGANSFIPTTQYMGGYGNFPDVVSSTQVYLQTGELLNFVTLSHEVTAEMVADRCDFGICQVSLSLEYDLYLSKAFCKDHANNTFTYLREPFDTAQMERSLRRWERLKEKFPGWTLVVPQT